MCVCVIITVEMVIWKGVDFSEFDVFLPFAKIKFTNLLNFTNFMFLKELCTKKSKIFYNGSCLIFDRFNEILTP